MLRQNVAELLSSVSTLVEIDELEEEDLHFIGFNGVRYSHSCEEMGNGWEAGFCYDTMFLITPTDEAAKELRYDGFTYACKRHLPIVFLRFREDLENRSLTEQFREWESEESSREAERQATLGFVEDINS